MPNDLGNACDWATNAAKPAVGHGFPVDSTPMVGDIVVFQPGDHDCNPVYGHVAYVEVVNSDGSFNISEDNVKNGGTPEKPRPIDNVWPRDKFIHRKPDLVVSNIKFYKPGTTEEFTPRAGQIVTFYAVLENNGGYKTVPYTVKWFLDGKEVGSGSNPSLAINACATNNVYFNWQATEGNHTIKFEADYICGILNVPIVEEFIYSSSDTRSFKIRPPVYIPRYDNKNSIHTEIAVLSKKAHLSSEKEHTKIKKQIEEICLKICDIR